MFSCVWIDPDVTKDLVLSREEIASLLYRWRMQTTDQPELFRSTTDEQESLLWVGLEIPNWDSL